MSEKRRGLGRGLGALIPSGTGTPPRQGDRPVDVFFAERDDDATREAEAGAENGSDTTEASKAGAASKRAGSGSAATAKAGSPSRRSASSSNGSSTATLEAVEIGKGVSRETTAGDVSRETADAGEGSRETNDTDSVSRETTPDDGLVPVPGARFAELPTTSIVPNPRQPRQVFDEEALAELAHSVREIGVLQPVVVRATGKTGADGEPAFELIMGERRWRAVQQAGLDRIPAIIRETSDDDLLRDALLENLHRSQLNALEEAAAYQQLLDDFGCTHEELASRIGRSRPQISNTIRLLRLPPAVQRRVAAGVLSAGHARALLGLDDAEAMDKLAGRIVAEGLSVRATEEAVALSDTPDAAGAVRRKPRPGAHHGELDDLAGRLADLLDTRVRISLGRSKGRLSVDFASVEDLNRILEILAPQERGMFQKV